MRDYIPHHEPFQYYAPTANPTTAAVAVGIGHDDPPGPADEVNHQYDLTDFKTRALAPATSRRSPSSSRPASEDGHAGYSGPLDEQRFLVETSQRSSSSPVWARPRS